MKSRKLQRFRLSILVDSQTSFNNDWPGPISSEKSISSLFAINEDGGLKDNLVGMLAVLPQKLAWLWSLPGVD